MILIKNEKQYWWHLNLHLVQQYQCLATHNILPGVMQPVGAFLWMIEFLLTPLIPYFLQKNLSPWNFLILQTPQKIFSDSITITFLKALTKFQKPYNSGFFSDPLKILRKFHTPCSFLQVVLPVLPSTKIADS